MCAHAEKDPSVDKFLTKVVSCEYTLTSSREKLLRHLYSTMEEFVVATLPFPRGGYITGGSGVGKTETMKAFAQSVPNFFPGVDVVYLKAGPFMPSLRSMKRSGFKLFVMVDALEVAYEQGGSAINFVGGVHSNMEICTETIVVGAGSPDVLAELITKSLADSLHLARFKHYGEIPKLNFGKFSPFPSLFPALTRDEFVHLATHIAEYFQTPAPAPDLVEFWMWLTGTCCGALHHCLGLFSVRGAN